MSKRKKSKAVRELEFGQEVSEVDAGPWTEPIIPHRRAPLGLICTRSLV
jgi:hypothetical protein